MNEFTTENGTVLYYKVAYELGGYNYFDNSYRERGYYVSIQRQAHEFKAFADLSDESGAVTVLLKEVTRKSKKAESESETLALEELKKVSDIYGL